MNQFNLSVSRDVRSWKLYRACRRLRADDVRVLSEAHPTPAPSVVQESSDAGVYTRGSVRRASGFVLSGNPEVIGRVQFPAADDTPGNTNKRQLGETRPDHSLWSLGEQVISR